VNGTDFETVLGKLSDTFSSGWSGVVIAGIVGLFFLVFGYLKYKQNKAYIKKQTDEKKIEDQSSTVTTNEEIQDRHDEAVSEIDEIRKNSKNKKKRPKGL